MAFVDTATVFVEAGHGGAGAVSFRKEKFVPKGGPDGGDGGRGGSVIFEASATCQTLMDIRLKKQYKAPNGQPGRPRKQYGANGVDLVLPVPCGTLVYQSDTQMLLADLVADGQQYVVARGGKGGRGNTHFSTAKHKTPRYAQPGLPGESGSISLELKLLADVGLVGLPNAGKSTLLKVLTGSKAKVAAYPFSTLRPNLGVLSCHGIDRIIADIPGLVEGADSGVGLGNAFLRHVSRTHMLIHLVSVAYQTPESCLNNYIIVLNELKKSGILDHVGRRAIITVLSQADVLNAADVDAFVSVFKQAAIDVQVISSITQQGLDTLKRLVVEAFE